MKFVVFEDKLGVVRDDLVVVGPHDLGGDPIRAALEANLDLGALGQRILTEGEERPMPTLLDPPIRRPSKIMAMGLNYLDHCRETNTPVPETPIEFSKHPSSLTGHGQPVLVDDAESAKVDYEVELAAIIGSKCRDLDAATALDAVAGYAIANDVSARDLQIRDGQWVRAKSFDSFTPLGPLFVTADEVDDPQALGLRTILDGDLVQDSSTSEMVFSIAELLAYVSRHTTLMPGDILLTGTPHGCGAFRNPPIYLRPGSTVTCSIDGLGQLVNPIAHHP